MTWRVVVVLAVCGPHPCAGEASRMNRPPRVGVGWRKADPLHPSEQRRSPGTPAFEDDRKKGNSKDAVA